MVSGRPAADALGADSHRRGRHRSPSCPAKSKPGRVRGRRSRWPLPKSCACRSSRSRWCSLIPAKTPDDGMTAGSGTTPRTIPSVRQAAAAVRKLLDDYQVEKPRRHVCRSGPRPESESQAHVADSAGCRTHADCRLAGAGKTANRVGGRADKVTGEHQFPSDIKRPGMLYGACCGRRSIAAS